MTAEKNPFDIDPDEKVTPKTDNKVVETPEDKAGTKQDKPTEPVAAQSPAKEADEKPKPKKARRTKAQIEADKAAEQAAKDAEGQDAKIDFNEVDFDKYPLSAVSGQVTGVIKLNGAVPILEIALIGWVGEAPVSVAAEQIGDVEKILKDLRKAAKDAKRS